MNYNKILSFFAIFLSCFGLCLIIVFAFNKSFNDGSYIINPDLASKYGSFIGGLVGPIFSFAGILWILITFNGQKQLSYVQQFESKFFELIKFHRDNVLQMEFKLTNGEVVKGNKVFIELKKQFEEINDIVNLFTKDEPTLKKKDKDKKRIQIAYIFFYYGVSKSSKRLIQNRLHHYNHDLINIIFDQLHKQKTQYDNSIVYFGGHQNILGHYFRNLFHTFMFLHNAKYLSKKDKYDFAKILRTQLSTFELAIFVYNVISPLGKKWEENNLIVEYQLIKNLPHSFLKDLNLKNYFYGISYEWEEYHRKKTRKKIKNIILRN